LHGSSSRKRITSAPRSRVRAATKTSQEDYSARRAKMLPDAADLRCRQDCGTT